jgi:hypothetical protein
MTRQEFETALDEHRLWIGEYIMKSQRWYLVRRNGRTKTWKTRPDRWEVPIAWKYRNTARIDEKVQLEAWFKAQPGPNAKEVVGAQLVR